MDLISPIDGRYGYKTKELKEIFSEYGLFKYRVFIEIKYYIFLCKLLNKEIDEEKCLEIYNNFTVEESEKIKEIEKKINHDVKAVEYYLQDKVEYPNLVHFGLTSQDINSVSYTLQIKDFIEKIWNNLMDTIQLKIYDIYSKTKNQVMLSHTHGQPASPTILGKEMLVYLERLKNQIERKFNCTTKFGGAVGNLNAHYYCYPKINWIKEMNTFIISLGLERNQYTTQIDHYDNHSIVFDLVKRVNVILIDLCQDIWTYISKDYFKLKINSNEVGSSTMPHKVNPIDFENAEGNFMMANCILQFMSAKLPVSRLQRDLTDCTILRNLGTAFGYTIIALKSLLKGLTKIECNAKAINKDLDENLKILAEPIQLMLKTLNIDNAYESLKELTRNNEVLTKEKLYKWISKLEISIFNKQKLYSLTQFNYIGKYNLA